MEIEVKNSSRKAIIDDEDYSKLEGYKLYKITTNTGAKIYVLAVKGRIHRTRLHRLIMNAPKNKDVDHKNHDTFDCRKSNLRICSRSQNSANQRRMGENYKGVTKERNRFRAAIKVNYKVTHLGMFDTAEEAARAYDNAAKEAFGEFALCNFDENE